MPANLWHWTDRSIIGWRFATPPRRRSGEDSSDRATLHRLIASLEEQLASAKRDRDIALELRDAMKQENEAMRAAIKEAHAAITTIHDAYCVACPPCAGRTETDDVAESALSKLQPFLP